MKIEKWVSAHVKFYRKGQNAETGKKVTGSKLGPGYMNVSYSLGKDEPAPFSKIGIQLILALFEAYTLLRPNFPEEEMAKELELLKKKVNDLKIEKVSTG